MPVDLAGQVDYAALLAARAQAAADGVPEPLITAGPAPVPAPAPVPSDAAALRRLFLELPVVTSHLRLLDTPPGPGGFARQRALLQRLDHASLSVLTMPALALAAPAQPLAPGLQQRRARHARKAVAALDEAWALLARAARSTVEESIDDAERITANLEHALAARRAIPTEDA